MTVVERASMHPGSGLDYAANGTEFDITLWRQNQATAIAAIQGNSDTLVTNSGLLVTSNAGILAVNQNILTGVLNPANSNVQLINGNGNALGVDSTTRAQTVITYPHHEIHASSAYFCQYSILADSAEGQEVRIEAPATDSHAHMTITMTGALAGTAMMWRATTKTHVPANVLPCVNRNFNSDNVSGMILCHTPAGAQAGASNLLSYYGATASGGRVSEGGGASNRAEFILKEGEAILLSNLSRADGNALNINLDWYMHSNRTD